MSERKNTKVETGQTQGATPMTEEAKKTAKLEVVKPVEDASRH